MDEAAPLTTGDVAYFCHVSHVTVFRWIRRGILNAYTTPGGHYRVQSSELIKFLQREKMPVHEELLRIALNSRSVLLVDDDSQIVAILKRALGGNNGLRVDVASGGYEACLKIGLKRPDLIVLDLFMPGFDGFSVIKEIRANPQTSECKILVLSGYGSDENKAMARELGADRFLDKPVKKRELLECINDLLYV